MDLAIGIARNDYRLAPDAGGQKVVRLGDLALEADKYPCRLNNMLHLQLEQILSAKYIRVDTKDTVLRAIVDQRINIGWVHIYSLHDVIVRVQSIYVGTRIRSRVPGNAGRWFNPAAGA